MQKYIDRINETIMALLLNRAESTKIKYVSGATSRHFDLSTEESEARIQSMISAGKIHKFYHDIFLKKSDEDLNNVSASDINDLNSLINTIIAEEKKDAEIKVKTGQYLASVEKNILHLLEAIKKAQDTEGIDQEYFKVETEKRMSVLASDVYWDAAKSTNPNKRGCRWTSTKGKENE